jgi:arylsulfatase A-like enzyme
MYEEALRTPLLLRFPKQVKAGQKADEMVMNIDIASTLLDFAGGL